jgi:hypothetical protein
MSTDPIGGQQNAEVVPLRAKDAGTETHTAESPRAAYTDLSDGRAQRKPILPAHWRTWETAREHVRLAAPRHGHAAAYHGVRVSAYLVLTAWWALVGVARTGKLVSAALSPTGPGYRDAANGASRCAPAGPFPRRLSGFFPLPRPVGRHCGRGRARSASPSSRRAA